MTTTQTILWILAGFTPILCLIASFVRKRKGWALLTASVIMFLPYTTSNLLAESGIWIAIFVLELIIGLIAIFHLANDTKEK